MRDHSIRILSTLGVGSFGKVFEAKGNFVSSTPTTTSTPISNEHISYNNNNHKKMKNKSKKTSKSSSNRFALKVCKKTRESQTEATILSQLSHPYIVKYLFSRACDGTVQIGMEMCRRGDLFDIVSRNQDNFRFDQVKTLILQVSTALDYIHSQNIVFGDLKPENICIGQDGKVRLIDFGLSTYISDENDQDQKGADDEQKISSQGTLYYAAPEKLMRSKCSFQVDYWSLGIILHELAFGLPWDLEDEEMPTQEKCRRICLEPLQFRDDMQPSLLPLFLVCWELLEKDPFVRCCSTAALQKMEFFQDAELDQPVF